MILSVVIVITAIFCDMPGQELSLIERVYSEYVYENRKSCSETRRKFRITFQEYLYLIPVQLGDRLKDSKKPDPYRIEKWTVYVMFLQKK